MIDKMILLDEFNKNIVPSNKIILLTIALSYLNIIKYGVYPFIIL